MALGVAGQACTHEPPLVGRAGELAWLEQVLDELDQRRPGPIELVRESGIGKTRLLRLQHVEPGPTPEPRKRSRRPTSPHRPSNR